MSERSSAPSVRPMRSDGARPVPPPEVVEFIRFCHRRRHVGWPEIYDEMCGVAARREFNGWGHDQLAEHGVTFALFQMPQLAYWVRSVLAVTDGRETSASQAVARPVPG